MKRAYAASKYAKPYEQYCRELYPEQAEEIFRKAEEHYKELMENDMPDLGENMMVTISWVESAAITGTWGMKAQC